MKQVAEPFEALPMPRKDIPQPASGSYRVYKNIKEFVTVEAGSALEALQASGVQSAYKIERESIDYIRVLEPSAWVSQAIAKAGAVIDAVQVAAAPITEDKETVLIGGTPAAEAPKTDGEPLSNDDVNKLLNS